jgi:hypothetical protein
MTKRKIQYWVIPPEADAEFVANMEEVLETYAQPYDSACPLICMDEQPVQLVKEIRKIIPATKTHARRVDYEYERAGTASIFMFAEPLAGWRQATAREHRTSRCRHDATCGNPMRDGRVRSGSLRSDDDHPRAFGEFHVRVQWSYQPMFHNACDRLRLLQTSLMRFHRLCQRIRRKIERRESWFRRDHFILTATLWTT